MDLRRGEPTDLSLVYRLEKQYIEDLESDQLQAWQGSLDRHLDQWVAALPRMTIAQSSLGVRLGYSFWERDAGTAVLASVNVDPPHRRKGVASALMTRFEEEVRQIGLHVVKLGFVSDNPARRLYEALGYRPAGSEGRYVLMTKHL